MTGQPSQQTTISANPYLELDNQGQLLHFELKADQHILGRDPQRADLLVPNSWMVLSNRHAILRKVREDYYIYDGDGHQPSTNGLFINHTRITPTRGRRLQNGLQIQIGQNPNNLILLTYFHTTRISPPTQKSLSLRGRSVLLGRDPTANLQLDSPLVSRRHATIDTDAEGRYLLQDHSANGTFVDGQRVNGSAVLPAGAIIRIGSYTLVLRDDELVLADQGDQIRLDAHNLVWEVKDKNRKVRRLLDNISLPIEPGQFVALVGGSGTGKSTLMRTLLGIAPTTEGIVYLNGEDLRANFNIYRTQIGYVPQDDIVHKELKVGEVLTYAAKLRLPTDSDVEQIVQNTLQQIEMSDRRDVLVSQLSGGQRKRVSIGVELLADPKLFFLDEPTSGLDPGLDKKMMQLLRKLAIQGRTVILVTHATANIALCDRVVFLGKGGRLCYFGSPQEALDFFGITTGDFADIYNRLEDEETVIQEAYRFSNSNYYQSYIVNHLSGGMSPNNRSRPQKTQRFPLGQLALLTQRNFQLIWRDPIYLGSVFCVTPVFILFVWIITREKIPLFSGGSEPSDLVDALSVLFVFTCIPVLVGIFNSLQDIIKESAIYLRERLVNLGLLAYVGSKVFVRSCLALVQTLLMSAVIFYLFDHPVSDASFPWFPGLVITTFLTFLASISLGLMLSALLKNASQANLWGIFLFMCQFLFAGILFKFDATSLISKFAVLMLSHWSVRAYGALVDINQMIPECPPAPADCQPVTDGYEESFYQPEGLGHSWEMLCLHIIVYLGVILWVQKSKDIL
ncbi:MAG: ATP-binding cassette domain-containing protein [Symploca sp. SIO2C1]|nr:ATP-binding cassette domain-containing protein [Symploca sp. SIO2C1]